MNKYEQKQWKLATNLLGVALVATVSSDLLARLSRLKVVPEGRVDLVADWGTLLVCFIVLFCAVTIAFSSTKKQTKQIPWIHKTSLPMWTGVTFFALYLAVIFIGGKSFVNFSWPTQPTNNQTK